MQQPKRLSPEQMLGERGVHLIGKRFLDMGFPWHATNAPLDAGIDGHIELRDLQTGEATNTWLAVQSKARTTLENEKAESFEFTCTPRDLDYWRRGNMPVLLVVSRPATEEAWWVSIKDYFRDPARANVRKISFDKRRTLQGAAAATELLAIAQNAGSGTYFRPAPKPEHLDLNLVQVVRFPAAIYRAETDIREAAEAFRILKKYIEYPESEWLLLDGAIYSVHDLRDGFWPHICKVQTVVSIDPSDWANSNDADLRRRFVRLLNACLKSMVSRLGMRRTKDSEGVLYFKATKDLVPKIKTYNSRQQKSSRTVFSEYRSKKDPARFLYYRHVGFEPRFRHFDGQWCLEINPTYVFTIDGKIHHPYHQEYLSKIKSIEGSGAVGNLVVMFSSLLRDRDDLFASHANYKHLGFGGLLGVDLNVGIDDQLWAQHSGVGSLEQLASELGENADLITSSVEHNPASLFDGEEA